VLVFDELDESLGRAPPSVGVSDDSVHAPTARRMAASRLRVLGTFGRCVLCVGTVPPRDVVAAANLSPRCSSSA
jgi:hypothetical protein